MPQSLVNTQAFEVLVISCPQRSEWIWDKILEFLFSSDLTSIPSFLQNTFENNEDHNNNVMVHFDTEKDLITVEQSIGVVDPSRHNSLARIGVQLHSNYLQQKFQLAIQSTTTKSENGWAECSNKQNLNRNCFLLNSDSFVLASNQNSEFNIPLHLSQIEPELFKEFLERELIKKYSWRDPNSLCPMIFETSRLRQQYITNSFSLLQQQQHLIDNSLYYSSALSHYSPLLQFLTFLFSWLEFLIPSFHVLATKPPEQFIPLENIECDDEAINSQSKEMLEHCIIEKTHFRIKLKENKRENKEKQAIWLREKKCNRTVGLLPFTHSDLYLLVLDGECLNKEKSSFNTNNLFTPNIRVPNCNLSLEFLSLKRKQRKDLDYTHSHPKEFNPICTSGSQSIFKKEKKYLFLMMN